MSAGNLYWKPICELCWRLRCWTRMAIDDGESRWTTSWGMLLKLPEEGYLEGPEGPWPLRHVRWVELSTARVKGGLAGRPREMIDFTEELLSELSAMQV